MADQKRGAPHKKGLNYFPKMIDFYEDDKIFDLMYQYGPKGVTIYEAILCIIYSHGYFVEISEDKLSRMVVRKIGSNWVKKRDVVQVIHACADIGLFDDALLNQGVFTSVGIQSRYKEIALKRMKRRLYNDKYWLLDEEENGEPLLKSPKNGISSEINGINSEENQLNSELNTPKKEEKIKEYIYRYFDNPELNNIFLMYIAMRNNNQKIPLNGEQIRMLKEELQQVAYTDQERIAVCRKAFTSGWKSFYPLKKGSEKKETAAKKQHNSFHNFDQRDIDYSVLEEKLSNKTK